jgi:hypothetical protein
MLNLIQTVLLLPFFIIGCIAGYLFRPILRGYYIGFYIVELKARKKLTEELQNEIDRLNVQIPGETNNE